MLVAGRYFIPESEFEWQFVRSPGPGGQNVNKVSTTARLLFRLAETFRFPPEVREKLCGKLRPRLSEEGVLAVTVRDTRSQLRNREERAAVDLDGLAAQAREQGTPQPAQTGAFAEAVPGGVMPPVQASAARRPELNAHCRL